MTKTKTLIALLITMSVSTFLSAKSKSDLRFNKSLIETITSIKEEPTPLEAYSTLTANLLNSMNALNTVNFCALKTILQSNNTNENKLTAISYNTGLADIYKAMVEINTFTTTNTDLIQSDATRNAFVGLLKEKVPYLGATERPNIDCRGYLAAQDNCAYNFGLCLAAACLTGPLMGVMTGLCGLAVMGCVDANDKANPACAAMYGINILPNADTYSEFNNICNQ
ncbi:MAG: hypothetical protein V4538_08770 [Bacteroidota bacterium]